VRKILAVILALCAIPAVVTGGQEDPSELPRLLRELRELRWGYYARRDERKGEITRAGTAVRKLEARVEDLSREEKDLRKEIETIRGEMDRLEKRREASSRALEEARLSMDRFRAEATRYVEDGIPYRREARLREARSSRVPGSISETLGGIWSFFQKELSIARTGEVYTEEVRLPDGRRKHARILRVGKQVLGYVTEDGEEVGLWHPGDGWRPAGTPGEAEAVRSAAEILDRRHAPEWIALPLRPGKGEER
jgi:hypothetical protein